jgi:site-specific DNA-methyltransferase (adenine-specific)
MSRVEVIGNASLHMGDCMEYMRAQPDRAFDLAIVDPPYFDGPNKSGYYGKGFSSLGVQRAKHYDTLPVWSVPAREYFDELQRISKHQIVWGANHFADRFNAASPSWIVWDKVNGESSFADVELAYCSMDRAARLFRYVWNGMHQGAYGGNKAKNEPRIHPTQKPVALYAWLLMEYSAPGQRVLDTHFGSASSAIAANQCGVEFVGTEIDPVMFEAACTRVRAAEKQPMLFPPPPKAEQMSLDA